MVDTKHRAIDRLDTEQRFKLDNIAASWRMEGIGPSEEILDISALYLLGEIDFAEQRRRIAALRVG